MPDITMCKDKVCPSNKSCYRYMAKPTKGWQSYFVGTPREEGEARCRHWVGLKTTATEYLEDEGGR